MNSAVEGPFKEILTAAKERRGDLTVDSMIVSSHLAQMRLFMLRRGVEFYAVSKIPMEHVGNLLLACAKKICLI